MKLKRVDSFEAVNGKFYMSEKDAFKASYEYLWDFFNDGIWDGGSGWGYSHDSIKGVLKRLLDSPEELILLIKLHALAKDEPEPAFTREEIADKLSEVMKARGSGLGIFHGTNVIRELNEWRAEMLGIEELEEEPEETEEDPEELPPADEPCPHPNRNGRHEWYLNDRGHDGIRCRACGAIGDGVTLEPQTP